MKLSIDTDRLTDELQHLASFTDRPSIYDPSLPQPQQAVTRIVFTGTDLAARAWFKTLAAEAGLLLREDAVGNTFARWIGDAPDLPAIGTGSHIDAIPHAGMYDGTVGVLGGLEAIRALQRAGFRPRRSLELVLFTSEEPTRFGIGCLGSRLMGGVLEPQIADDLPDRLPESVQGAPAGSRLRTVREAAGFQGQLAAVRLPRGYYAGWVELHIEQGPLLERDGEAIGIVTAIAGPSSYRFTVTGLGGHAGALLMPDRRDALCAAAEVVLAVEDAARAANQASGGADTVATVGWMDVFPGAVNAVPSQVTFSLDLRDTDGGRRDGVMMALRAQLRVIEERRKVRIAEEAINADAPVVCDPRIVGLVADVCERDGIRYRRMVSRAYHDSSFIAAIAPVAMIFLPCRCDEYAPPKAIATGVQALAGALAQLSLQP